MNIDKVIIALDVDTAEQAVGLIEKLPDISLFKVGWQLFASEGINVITKLRDADHAGFNIFLDLKIDDIPDTVEAAVRTLTQSGLIRFFSFQGDEATLNACREGSRTMDTEFLFVPTLSSRPEVSGSFRNQLKTIHPPHLLDGVVASGPRIGWAHRSWPDWTIVAPGIRSIENRNPHAMVSTPQEAFIMGADYIVIGREVTVGFDNPQEALYKIL